jgi:hypothetical protein
MTLDLKMLKKLADTCRKSGIREFEGYGYKFTLDDAPVTADMSKAQLKASGSVSEDKYDTDSLTDEELMFWSAGAMPTAQTDGQESE